MVCVAAAGTCRPASAVLMWSLYRVDSTLPITATPSAPPTCRATALEADPIPESPWGTEPTTEFVAVGSSRPVPRPISSMPGTTIPYVVAGGDTAETHHKPPAIAAKPAATVHLIPAARATIGDSGALTQSTAAIGRIRNPAWRGE